MPLVQRPSLLAKSHLKLKFKSEDFPELWVQKFQSTYNYHNLLI